MPNTPAITWGNLIVNLQKDLGAAWNWNIADGATLHITGNLDIRSTGPTPRDLRLTGTGIQNINIGGDLLISGGSYLAIKKNNTGTATGYTTMQVNGDIIMRGSATLFIGITSTSPGMDLYELRFKGDLSSDPTNTITTGTTDAFIVANGESLQSIAILTTMDCNFQVENTAGLSLSQPLIVTAIFEIEEGNTTLNNNDLSVNSILQTAPATTNHIITNGSGVLKISTVGATMISFPIGVNETSINALVIYNGGGFSFGARVEPGIQPASIAFSNNAVNLTWTIQSSYTGPAVNVNFFYNPGDANGGFNYAGNVELGQYISGTWNVPQTGITPAGSYQASTHSITSFNTQFVIGNLGAILPLGCFISCHSQKQNDHAKLSWTLRDCSNTDHFEVERSVNGSSFTPISSILVNDNFTEYSYKDFSLENGTNLYRIKAVLEDGRVKYSNIVSVLNKSKSIYITPIIPNPAHDHIDLVIRSTTNMKMKLLISDLNGKIVRKWDKYLTVGINTILLSLDNLEAGAYFFSVETSVSRSNIISFVKQ